MHMFIIGEAGSSTHQPACPTRPFWSYLKLLLTSSTWFDFQAFFGVISEKECKTSNCMIYTESSSNKNILPSLKD